MTSKVTTTETNKMRQVTPSVWLTVHGVRDNARKFARNQPIGALAGFIVAMLVLTAIFAPFIATHDYAKTDVVNRLVGPTSEHWLGADNLGRDEFSRLVWGTRVSMVTAFTAVLISTALATLIGLASGYLGGWFDIITQRFVDIWMSFPGIILVLTLIAMFQPGIVTLALSIGLVSGGLSSRLVRSNVLLLRQSQFVEAASVLGAGHLRIVLRHILPNIVPILIVLATAQVAVAILLESTVSYLGYGVQPPRPSWGNMLSGDARTFMLQQPLLALWPGVAIFVSVYSFNMLGDALRDTLDPRLRGGR